MAKWVFTRAGTWDYPTLGFTATTDDIIEADLAPDAWWDETDSGATPTIPVVPSGGVEEPASDSLLVYNAVTNRGEWTPLTDLGLDEATLSSTYAARSAPSWASGTRAYDPRLHTYNLRPETLTKWRRGRALADAGTGVGHVACYFDSLTYGAGSSAPKYLHSVPGRLRALFERHYGASPGTGVAIPFDTWFDTPADDPRLVITGTAEKLPGFGPYGLGAIRWLDGSGANYVEFTATCTEFVVYGLSGGSRPRVAVDGGAEEYILGAPNLDYGLTNYDPEAGYQSNGANGQIVTTVPAGALGSHTLRILAPVNGTNHAVIFGVDANTGSAGVKVSSVARNGLASSTLVGTDDTNFMSGMACHIDAIKADVAVMTLGMNDFNTSVAVATFKTNALTAIARQRSSAALKPNGDVLLVVPAQPNYTQTPAIADYYRALYEIADEQNVALLDLAARWQDYATADALTWWADGVHPNDAGAADQAAAIFRALMAV